MMPLGLTYLVGALLTTALVVRGVIVVARTDERPATDLERAVVMVCIALAWPWVLLQLVMEK